MPGRSSAYDDLQAIADAAMYLKTTNPDLGITDPYVLTQEQFDASVDLLKQQHAELTGASWSLWTDEVDGFVDGSMVAGTAAGELLLCGSTPRWMRSSPSRA